MREAWTNPEEGDDMTETDAGIGATLCPNRVEAADA